MLLRRLPNRIMGSVPLMGGGQSYAQKVLGYNPLAYWPLWEPSGGVAYDISGNGLHGAYTGVTLGQPGIGDGRTCPYFDGLNDYVNVLTAGFKAAFDAADEMTILCWLKMIDWSDGSKRWPYNFIIDGDNRLRAYKFTDDKFYFVNTVATTQKTQNEDCSGYIGWYTLAMTRSEGVDQTKFYRYWNNGDSGGQLGSTQTGIGTWTDNDLVGALIGAEDVVPNNCINGWEAHVSIFPTALNITAITDLATV